MNKLDTQELFLAPHRTPAKQWLKNYQNHLIALATVFLIWSIFDVIWSLLLYKTILWNKVLIHSITTTVLISLLYHLVKLSPFKTAFTPINIAKPSIYRKKEL